MDELQFNPDEAAEFDRLERAEMDGEPRSSHDARWLLTALWYPEKVASGRPVPDYFDYFGSNSDRRPRFGPTRIEIEPSVVVDNIRNIKFNFSDLEGMLRGIEKAGEKTIEAFKAIAKEVEAASSEFSKKCARCGEPSATKFCATHARRQRCQKCKRRYADDGKRCKGCMARAR